MTIKFRIEAIHETERCWTATVPVLPEIVTHGATRSEAIAKIQPLALRALANRLEQGTPAPNLQEVLFDVAKEYRLGVLFVHGIGRQRPGDALIQWGDVLVKTIPFVANGQVSAIVGPAEPGGVSSGESCAEAVVRLRMGDHQECWLLSDGW